MVENDKNVFNKFDELNKELHDYEEEEAKWNVQMDDVAKHVTTKTVITSSGFTEEQMKSVFNKFDSDNSGNIDSLELYNALKSLGQELTMEQINELINEIDINGDGKVDFNEFKVLFGQSKFINIYQNELIKNMTRMVTTMTHMDQEFIKELEMEYKQIDSDVDTDDNDNDNDDNGDIIPTPTAHQNETQNKSHV